MLFLRVFEGNNMYKKITDGEIPAFQIFCTFSSQLYFQLRKSIPQNIGYFMQYKV